MAKRLLSKPGEIPWVLLLVPILGGVATLRGEPLGIFVRRLCSLSVLALALRPLLRRGGQPAFLLTWLLFFVSSRLFTTGSGLAFAGLSLAIANLALISDQLLTVVLVVVASAALLSTVHFLFEDFPMGNNFELVAAGAAIVLAGIFGNIRATQPIVAD